MNLCGHGSMRALGRAWQRSTMQSSTHLALLLFVATPPGQIGCQVLDDRQLAFRLHGAAQLHA